MGDNYEVISTSILWLSFLISASILVAGFIFLQIYLLKKSVSELQDDAYIDRITKARQS